MKLPEELLNPLLSLLFYFGKRKQTVIVEFVEDKDGKLKILVPEQTTTDCSASANFKLSCDLITGEMFNQFPPDGHRHLGGAYCHNTMMPFFSATTDASELNIPGIHLCFGSLNKKCQGSYEVVASEVKNKKRYPTPAADVIESVTSSSEHWYKDRNDIGVGQIKSGYSYHPNVNLLVHRWSPHQTIGLNSQLPPPKGGGL